MCLYRFSDGVPSGQFESAPWRSKILSDLKKIRASEVVGYEKYEVAVEMWVTNIGLVYTINTKNNQISSVREMQYLPWYNLLHLICLSRLICV